jgi:hypothetical protein
MLPKYLPLLVLPVLLILLIPVSIYAQETTTEIPVWVKGVANFWVDGNINDAEFGEAITFLIEQGIFKIDSVAISEPIQDMSDNEKRMFELETKQKDDRISILENEKKVLEKEKDDFGLDNSHLLLSITDMKKDVKSAYSELDKKRDELQQYKKDYPIKIGNIGGKLVVDYIQELEEEIRELKK